MNGATVDLRLIFSCGQKGLFWHRPRKLLVHGSSGYLRNPHERGTSINDGFAVSLGTIAELHVADPDTADLHLPVAKLFRDYWRPAELRRGLGSLVTTKGDHALASCLVVCQVHSEAGLHLRVLQSHLAEEAKLWAQRQRLQAQAQHAVKIEEPERFICHLIRHDHSKIHAKAVVWPKTCLVFDELAHHLASAEGDSDLVTRLRCQWYRLPSVLDVERCR